jgi:hypothetical protein
MPHPGTIRAKVPSVQRIALELAYAASLAAIALGAVAAGVGYLAVPAVLLLALPAALARAIHAEERGLAPGTTLLGAALGLGFALLATAYYGVTKVWVVATVVGLVAGWRLRRTIPGGPSSESPAPRAPTRIQTQTQTQTRSESAGLASMEEARPAEVAATMADDAEGLRRRANAGPDRRRAASHGFVPESSLAPLAALLAAVGLGGVIRAIQQPALRVVGCDLASKVAAIAPLLGIAALGAALARQLLRRHPGAATALPVVLSALALAAAYVATQRLDALVTLADRIQQPTVARREYLFGVALLAIVVANGLPFVLGGIVATACGPRAPCAVTAAALALGAAASWLAPVTTALLATLAAVLAAAAAARSVLLRLTLLASAALAAAALDFDRRPLGDGFRLEDDVRSLAVGERRSGTETPDGRPYEAPLPPGWPFAAPGDEALLRRAITRAPAVLVGEEAAALASRLPADATVRLALPGDDALEPHHRDETAIFLPRAFDAPLPTLAALERRAREYLAAARNPNGSLAFIVDLATTDLDALAAVDDVAVRLGLDRTLVLEGRHALFLGTRSEAESTAGSGSLRSAFSPEALDRFFASPARREALLLAAGRRRLDPVDPRAGALRLRQLLAAADRLDLVPPGDPTAPHLTQERARLELAAAILADDYPREDRALALLATLAHDANHPSPSPAAEVAALRRERRAARERILDELIRRVFAKGSTEGADADLRFRLGEVLAATGRPLAAIDEFTSTITSRPSHHEGWVRLAEAYVEADARGDQRVVRGTRLDHRRMPFDLERFFQPIRDRNLEARILAVRAAAQIGNAIADGTGSATGETELRNALGRLRSVLEVDPREPRLAHARTAETTVRLARDHGVVEIRSALPAARLATAADPLDAKSWLLRAALEPNAPLATRALRTWLTLGPARD